MTRFVTAAFAAAVLAVSAQAAPLKVGSPAPKFSGLETADGKSVSMSDFKDKDVLVVCITCNHCPVAIAYQDRLVAFAKKYCGPDGKVGLVAINVNNTEADKLPKMKDVAKEKGFKFPYAYDPSQKIARELGAAVTPEFFVFDKERRLVYTGAMDDAMTGEVTKHYLTDAVDAALKGETPKVQTSARKGCGIQYERK
jgi:peroxiredoxin